MQAQSLFNSILSLFPEAILYSYVRIWLHNSIATLFCRQGHTPDWQYEELVTVYTYGSSTSLDKLETLGDRDGGTGPWCGPCCWGERRWGHSKFLSDIKGITTPFLKIKKSKQMSILYSTSRFSPFFPPLLVPTSKQKPRGTNNDTK